MRYFENTLKEQNLGVLEPEVYRDWALECMKDTLRTLEQEGLDNDSSNYTGYCGVAYAMYHLTSCLGQGKALPEDVKRLVDQFAEKSVQFSELSFHSLEGKGHEWSIFFGQAGAALVSALCWQTLYQMSKHKVDLSSKVIARVQRFVEISQSAQDVTKCKEDEVLYGRAGYILGFAFLEASLDPCFSSYLKSSRSRLVSVAKTIMDQGYRNAREIKHQEKCPLWWEWHSSAYLGAAHGSMGALCYDDHLR
jgi:hypothetical protein